jgi:hypothetical protein
MAATDGVGSGANVILNPEDLAEPIVLTAIVIITPTIF